MRTPLITIIVPVYNTEQYVADCIESVLCQTYPHFELILVNDGSKDGSLKICEEYADCDSRICLFSQENRGSGMTRNLALDHMHGDYVCFLDSDDTLVPETLETLMRYVADYPVDAVFFGMVFDTGFHRIKRDTFSSPTVLSGAPTLLREYVSTHRLSSCTCDKMYRAEIFREVRFSSLRRHEDAYILPELFSKIETAVCIGDPLYIQRIREGSLERSGFSENSLAWLDCEKELQRWVQKLCPDMMGLIAYRTTNAIASLMGIIIEEFQFFKYAGIYRELNGSLEDAYLQAQKYVTEESVLSGSTQLAMNAPVIFAVKHIVLGVKKQIRHRVKRVLLKGKCVLNSRKDKV